MIEQGSTVTIHYTLTVEDEPVESSFESKPLTYQHGEGRLIQGLEEKLEGRNPGDVLEVSVPPEKAYGEHNPENVVPVKKSAFGDPDAIQVGSYVEGQTQQGQPFRARVSNETEDSFVLDLNHPLAGKTLDFKVEVLSVDQKTGPVN